jgi:LL-diaminopimelate aminotransferase/alanine-synthesizing transaminase
VDVQRFKYIGHEQATVARFRDFLLEHRPKVVLLVSPDNPTSQVLSQDFVASAYGAVKTYGGAVVMDFAYKTLVFGDTPEYFAWPPDGNFISMHSNSKWCHGLGRRLGWVEAPEYIVDAFESFQNSSVLCPDRMHQMVLAEYLFAATKDGSLRRYAAGVRERYAATAAATIDAVRCHLRLPHLVPQGGLYTCIQVDENGAAFVDRVLKNTGVLFIPGWGFGHSLNRAVRVSYGPHVNDHRMIDVGFRRVEEYLCHASSDHETG